jgi:hypothetical protein
VEKSADKSKQVSWRISEALRHRLLSHAEYLSVEKETTTESMVAEWLGERLKIEEMRRSLRTLGTADDVEWQDMKADKGQFDEVLRRILDKPPQKTADIKAEKSKPAPKSKRRK